MSNAIDTALAAAKEAKARAEAEAANTNLPATTTAAAGVPATAQTPLSAESMMQGSFAVDAFVKVSEDGMKIGDKAGLIETMRVSIDLSEVFYYFGVKYGSNPAIYKKTQNKAMSLDGTPWSEVLATAARVDGAKFKGEYRSGARARPPARAPALRLGQYHLKHAYLVRVINSARLGL